MRLELVPRTRPSATMAVLSPFMALGLTMALGFALFTVLGVDPFRALYIYFVEPLTMRWSLEELLVKAAPLILIAIGLSVCFRANVWNIGAEGQFTVGALFGAALPVMWPGWETPLVLIPMLLLGMIGGALYASIPALLKNRFGANEILTSLMLTYVALLLLDWMVRGPWRDPAAFNFPESRLFDAAATLPLLAGTGRLHVGILFGLVAALFVAWRLNFTVQGFAVRLTGQAPRAARFAGFDQKRLTLLVFCFSGGLAGLAGITEVAGTIHQLRPTISPGYGFAAIIVAFLGRLSPIGIIFAGLLLALTYLGGEAAQVTAGLSDKVTRVFQGALLFLILACDTLVRYRIRLRPRPAPVAAPAPEATHG